MKSALTHKVCLVSTCKSAGLESIKEKGMTSGVCENSSTADTACYAPVGHTSSKPQSKPSNDPICNCRDDVMGNLMRVRLCG